MECDTTLTLQVKNTLKIGKLSEIDKELCHTENKTSFCSVTLTYHQLSRVEKKHVRFFNDLTLVTFKVPVQPRVRHMNLPPCL